MRKEADHATKTMVCERCGRPDAVRIGDRIICPDCYDKAGSCCPEFGADDLWEFPGEDGSGPPETPGKSAVES